MSLPPPASFTWQRKRGRCKIALTCYLLIAFMLVRNAQAGVIKKREIPSATGMDMGKTTAVTPANVLVSSIRAAAADPDIEVGELNRTQALPTRLTPLDSHDSGMATKLQPMGRGFGTSSQEQAMANEIAQIKNPSSIDSSPEFEKKLQEVMPESTLKTPAQSSLNEENSNETPRRAPVATENPILKLANNLGQNFQEKVEGLSGQVLHSLNDIVSKETTQENAKEIDSGTKIASFNPSLEENTNSGNIMVLTTQSKEKSDDVQTKIVGKNMDMSTQANLSQDVEVMALGPDNRPVFSVSSTHENLANLADTQEVMGNSGDTSQKAFATESGKDTQEFPLKGYGNSQESQNVGATNNINSQESLRTKNPETNSGKNNENPLESYILKVDNEIPSKDNENPPGSPNKIPQESQNGDRENSQHSQESQGAQSVHGGISQESQNTLKENVQENPIKIQEIPSNAQENPIKNLEIPKNAQENSQESQNSPVNLHYTTLASNINNANSQIAAIKENPQDSQNAKEKSQNVEVGSNVSAGENGSDQLSQSGSTFQNVNTNPQNSENIHENPQEFQNSKENLQKSPILGENSQESQKAENIQESQKSLATTILGHSQESKNTLENNDSVAKDSQNANENPQTSPQREENGLGNSPNATENPQESQNTLEVNVSTNRDSLNTNENLHAAQNSDSNENSPNEPESQITLKISSNAEGNTVNELASQENEKNLEGKSSPENSVKEIDENAKNNGNPGDFLTSTKSEEQAKSFKELEDMKNPANHNLNEISSKESLLPSGKSGKEESNNLAEKDGNPDGKLGLNLPGNQEENTTKSPQLGQPSAIENNLQSRESNLEVVTADRSNQTADLAKTTTLRDNSLESNHINADPAAITKGDESVFSTKVLAGESGNKFSNSSGHIQDALDSDSWKEVTNDLPDRTTEKAPEANPSPKPMDKVEYGRSMFGNGEKIEGEEESTTLPAHIANNLDFGELQKNSSSQRPKQPKFINENSSNAQQMNLPNNPEVWSLAGMKNPNSNSNFNLELQKTTTTEKGLAMAEKSQEMREPFESEKSQQGLNEKSLLDWSHIITDKDLLQATTEQYEGMELLGNSSTNKITANSDILSMAGEDDKTVKMGEKEEGERKDNLPTQVTGGEESATTESFVEFVASPKTVAVFVGTHEQQQQQPDTNLTLTQQQPANTTAVASDEPGAVITFENNPREQSFINHNNLTDSEREPVTQATAVITESSHSQPEVQKTTVESNVNSFVEPFAESTTLTVPTTTRNTVSDDFGLKANITENSNTESSGEENNSRFPEVTTYKPKFVITTKTTTETETATTSPANEAESATTKTIPLAEVIDQNGNSSNSHDNELQQKQHQQQQSINIETTTTTTSLDTTTLASQEPSAEVTGATVLVSSFEGQFSSTNKTHLNEQLVANITTTTTQATTTTTSTTDIPFEATSSTTTISEAKENTTSSSTEEIIKKPLEEATTTPSPQQEAKEATQPGEAGQEEQTKNNSQEQIKTTTTTEQNIIIGLPYTTTTEVSATKEEEKATKEEEATKEETTGEKEKEEDTKKEIETITTTAVPILATETPVVGHSNKPHTTTSTPELNTTPGGEEGATTEKGVETYFKFPLRGGNQKPATTTPTPLPEIITTTTQATKREEEAEVEGSGGGEYAEGVELTTMSLPESTTTTSTSTSTTAVTDETFISLLDDSTTTTTTTTTTTSIPPIIIKTTTTAAETTTEASSSTTATTLKGLEEEVYKIISNSSATAASPTTTSEIPHTTLIDYLETTTTTTTMIPTTTSNSTTTTMVIQTANIGGTGGNSLPPLDTIMIPNGGDNNMFTKNSNDSGETDVNVIIAITVSVIGVVALILLVAFLYLMRKRQKQTSYSQRCRPVSLDEYAIENGSIGGGSIRKGSAFRSSKRTYGNLAFDDPSIRHNPLGVHDLAKFATEKLRIFEEFRDVPQITARDDEVPPGVEDKNRYANVLPLPETRVILQRLNDDEKTEYINANYVSGPKDSPNYYIACQAPLETTVEDFWRMIWEQQSRVIIQATDLIENGIEKCFEYLPPSVTLDNHATFGDFQVTLQNREVKDKYAISTILLKNTAENNASRELTHYWYKWPETGVPVEEAPIIAMLLEARSSLISYAIEQANEEKEKSSAPGAGNTLRSAEEGGATNGVKDGTNSNGSSNAEINGNISMVPIKKTARNQGPLTVHCSPGTGRTGTIIACDIAIRSLETPKRTVDIPHIVYYVRRGRASAVLTKEQYEFIYKVANMYAAKITNPSNYN